MYIINEYYSLSLSIVLHCPAVSALQAGKGKEINVKLDVQVHLDYDACLIQPACELYTICVRLSLLGKSQSRFD